MAIRAKSGPTLAKNSATPGGLVTVTAKIENSGAEEARVRLVADLGASTFAFDPSSFPIPPKSRTVVTFTWAASLPEGKPAHTYRGKLILTEPASGRAIADAPLDLYVG